MLSIQSGLSNPLMHLLSEPIVNLYFQLLSFFLQVRSQKALLNQLWKDLQTEALARLSTSIPEDIIKKLLIIRHSVDTVMNQYLSYIHQFCVESQWMKLKKNIVKAATFNQLFKVHHTYLTEISRKCLVDKLQPNPNRTDINWLMCVSEFDSLVLFTNKGAFDPN